MGEELRRGTQLASDEEGEADSKITFREPNFDESVSVRYYLRCIFLDAKGRKFWNTVEVVMARVSPVLAGSYAPLVSRSEVARVCEIGKAGEESSATRNSCRDRGGGGLAASAV